MSFFGPTMPYPQADPDTQEFWDACNQHRLVIQQCTNCKSFRFAPVAICYNCNSWDYENVESEGIGEVFTWTISHLPIHPAVEQAIPFNIVAVKLLDCGGATMTSNLVGVKNEDIKAGMRVKVEWDEVQPGVTLPRFRPI